MGKHKESFVEVPFDAVVYLLLVLWPISSQHCVQCARKTALPKICGNYKIVDLSHNFNDRTIYWMDDSQYHLNVTVFNATEAGWFQMDVLEDPIHGGTHLDSPVHFAKGGWDASGIPLERLMFLPVARVDVRDRVATNPEYLLSVSDILDWEEENGHLPDGCLLLAHTGHSQYWPDRVAYMGIDQNGTRHFPAVSPEAASFLATNRSVFGVGLDSASVDAFGDTASHRNLLGADIFVLENLNALERVPTTGALALVLPLKLDGASGSPVRVVALVS